ncbi:PepSY domain-containing protein [Parvularcula flava]|uniref:PepSY domain-containing protein n=1 Tax=Aquisalinus luteolus TaxID=1566827 RepID=A0A8J3A5I4_9PROT|nr:PepSY domain-containing protein [Aquisalinus luteolus]NHK28842.1 PepSY domain-containing protein [Aquisalinus luteolus]GGH99681.1 hypothetical protein GCM10011355_26210 [Aquisalinus luteolus]
MSMKILTVSVAATIAISGAAIADDDRYPTSTELAAIEQVLTENGYVSWEEVEFDDGLWEVDDARDATRAEFDIKINPDTYEIVSTVRED